jgi:DNA modification methylase
MTERRIEYLRLADLRPAPRNPKLHDLESVGSSIGRFGYTAPIELDERTGRMVAGHGRRASLLAAKSAGQDPPDGVARASDGEWLVPVLRGWSSRSDDEAEAYLLASNQTTIAGGWDDEAVGKMLADLRSRDVDVTGLGFSDEDVSKLLDGAGTDPGGDGGAGAGEDAPEPQGAPQSVQGTIYELGPHRLLCGDSTDGALVARLFGQDKAWLVWTDPPYGIAYTGGITTGAGGEVLTRNRMEIANDGDEEIMRDVMRMALANACAHVRPGAACYAAAAAGKSLAAAMQAYSSSGFELRHVLVWVKDTAPLSRCDYHYRHETILYGWKPDGPHFFVDDRTQTSVFEFPRPKHSEEHPTMKPVELVERMVRNSSLVGQLVYDPFSGSGTTLMACARTNRRFVGCELEPRYADVIRRRWTAWATTNGVPPGPGALL